MKITLNHDLRRFVDKERLETAAVRLKTAIEGYNKFAKRFGCIIGDLKEVLEEVEKALDEKPFMYVDGDKIELEPVGEGERKYSEWNQKFKEHLNSLSGEEEE